MSWLEEYEQKLSVQLDARIKKDFPNVPAGDRDRLVDFLLSDKSRFVNAVCDWLNGVFGSTGEVKRFLSIYWPERAEHYRAGRRRTVR